VPEPILIKYATSGVGDVNRAFDTIEKRIVGLTAAANKGQATRVQGARSEANAAEAEYTKLAKWAEKMQADQTKAAERETRARAAMAERQATMAGRLAEKAAKEELRAAQEGTRALEREMSARARIRERSAAMAGRYAEQEAAAEISARRRIGTVAGGAVLSGTGRVIGGIASMAGMALGAAGAFGVADAARSHFSAERTASQLINAVTAGGKVPEGANMASILGQAGGVAIKTGMSKEQVIEGTLAYSRSAKGGDFAGAMGNMGFLAKLSKTTGTSMTDLGQAAGVLQSQNAGLKAPEMQQMLLNAYEQSKAGSVSLVDAAKQFGVLGSTRGMYNGDMGKNQRTLLALGQLAAPGGSPEEIGTYIKDVSTQAMKHGDKLRGFGAKMTDGKFDSPEDMIAKAFGGTGGNLGKLEKIFGLRGMPLISQLEPAYSAASKKAGGGAAGRAAGEAAIKSEIAGVAGATMTPGQLDQQFSQVMSTSAERFSVAIETIREKVEEKVVPFLDKFAEKLGDPAFMSNIDKIIDSLASLAGYLLDNPLKGVGAAIALSITNDLTKAALGAAAKAAMTKVVESGMVGAGSLITAAIIAGITGAKAIGGANEESLNRGHEAGESHVAGLLQGAKSPEEAKKKAALIKEALGAAESTDTKVGYGTALLRSAETAASKVSGKDVGGVAETTAREEHARVIRAHTDELKRQLAKLQASGNGMDSNAAARNEPIAGGASPR
jgi:hypothetical protein